MPICRWYTGGRRLHPFSPCCSGAWMCSCSYWPLTLTWGVGGCHGRTHLAWPSKICEGLCRRSIRANIELFDHAVILVGLLCHNLLLLDQGPTPYIEPDGWTTNCSVILPFGVTGLSTVLSANLHMRWFIQPIVGHCQPCEGSWLSVHQPPHAEHVSWTPAAASVHAGMHTNGCEGRGGWYLHVGQSRGQHWHCRGQHVWWGVWVGGVCPDAFSTLVGSKGSKRREANQLWFISPHTSRVSQTMGLPCCFLPTPKPICSHTPTSTLT